MKVLILLLALCMLCAATSGCVTVRKVRQEITSDQVVEGNRGYLEGQPSLEEEPVERRRTREIIQIDVELPTIEWPE